jgi:hypothetical protein
MLALVEHRWFKQAAQFAAANTTFLSGRRERAPDIRRLPEFSLQWIDKRHLGARETRRANRLDVVVI